MCDCRMTNLVSLVDKLLRYLEELLEFFGHYAKGGMSDRGQKSGKVCCVVCRERARCAADVSFGGPLLYSLTLSLAGTHACSH